MKNDALIYKGTILFIITLFLVTNIITATDNDGDNDITCNADDWPMYQHDSANTGFSSSPFPDSLNLSYNLNYSEITNSTFLSPYSSPIVANGKIFIAGRGAETDIFALDENNGSLIWKKSLPLNEKSPVFIFPNSPVVSNGKVFICFGSIFSFPPQSKIFALDENTGEIIWESYILTTSGYPSVTVSNVSTS